MITIRCEIKEDAAAVLENTVWAQMRKGEVMQIWVWYDMSITCACLNDPIFEGENVYLDMQCVVRKYEDHKETESWVFDNPDEAANFIEVWK